MSPHNVFLTTSQAAQYLNMSPRTLEKKRVLGGGPAYVRMSGRLVRYRLADLTAWADANLRRSTSDPGPGQSPAPAPAKPAA